MDYEKNLNGHFSRKKRHLIIGILLIVVAITYFLVAFFDKGFNAFILLYTVILLLNGVFIIARSQGKMLLHKAYIRLDDNTLKIKTISKKKQIAWHQIDAITFANKQLKISPWSNHFQEIDLSYLDPQTFEEIVDRISTFAKAKEIPITIS